MCECAVSRILGRIKLDDLFLQSFCLLICHDVLFAVCQSGWPDNGKARLRASPVELATATQFIGHGGRNGATFAIKKTVALPTKKRHEFQTGLFGQATRVKTARQEAQIQFVGIYDRLWIFLSIRQEVIHGHLSLTDITLL